MSQDEMKSNVEQLARLQTGLEQARDDLDGINEEERLLEWEQSFFPQLNQMLQLKEPYDKLWNTAWAFHQKHENWMNGIISFRGCLVIMISFLSGLVWLLWYHFLQALFGYNVEAKCVFFL